MQSLANGPFGCHGSHVVLFAPPGKPFGQVNFQGTPSYPEVASLASNCGSVANATHVFDQITLGSLPNPKEVYPAVRGIGDEARLLSATTARQRVDVVYWRAGGNVGEVAVLGPPGDRRITPALAKELAERAVN